MTVFCWDGKYLAVDSRRTVKKVEVYDDSHKLDIDFRGVKFEGSYVRAVARAGNTKTTRFMKACLRQEDGFIEALRKRWDEEKSGTLLIDDNTTRITKMKKGTLFIITRKKVWHFQIDPSDGILLREIPAGETFSGGSGGKIGKFLMDTFGLSAQLAVCATMIHMQCCGGPVRYVQCRGLLSKIRSKIEVTEFKDAKDLKREVMVRMRRMCGAAVKTLQVTEEA
jgi:hypothetical protein